MIANKNNSQKEKEGVRAKVSKCEYLEKAILITEHRRTENADQLSPVRGSIGRDLTIANHELVSLIEW